MKIKIKKILLLFLVSLILPVYAATWKQIEEKQYVDIDSIEQYKDKYSSNTDIVAFWIKSLNNKSKAFLDDEKYYNKKSGIKW